MHIFQFHVMLSCMPSVQVNPSIERMRNANFQSSSCCFGILRKSRPKEINQHLLCDDDETLKNVFSHSIQITGNREFKPLPSLPNITVISIVLLPLLLLTLLQIFCCRPIRYPLLKLQMCAAPWTAARLSAYLPLTFNHPYPFSLNRILFLIITITSVRIATISIVDVILCLK